MKIFTSRFGWLIIITVLLVGCGNTGPLEMPADSPAHNAHHPPVEPVYPIDE